MVKCRDKKTLVLVSAILGIGLILLAYNFKQDKDGHCSDLNEEECFNSEKCHGMYGPSTSITMDIRFKGCAKLSNEEIEKAKQNKILCEKTDGKWNIDQYIKIGRCDCQQSYFREGEGCMSLEEDCKKFGGEWKPAGTLKCDTSTHGCQTDGTLAFDICICPNGEFWNYENRCF